MILVLGYGNPLRTDDALGQHVAWELKHRFRAADLLVRITHQLTPELAEIVSHFDHIVFIDARVGDTPGQVVQELVRPLTSSTGAFTHNVTPATLLGAARALYGSAPTGLLISVVGDVFDYGTDLSPQLHEMLPEITGQVADIIRQYTGIQTGEENHYA